jgi:hypothetical protein
MSFRLFVYYCGLCGAWSAFGGWVVAKLFAPETPLWSATFQALTLGMAVAAALAIVDGLWQGLWRWLRLAPRVGLSAVLGGLGGGLGGLFGQAGYSLFAVEPLMVFGWTLTGLLVGAAVGGYDVLRQWLLGKDARGTVKKLWHGTLGGTVGGFLGGVGFVAIRTVLSWATGRAPDELLSSSAVGFVALGSCIGLFIGLAQVILKEAWIRVEVGFRAGRELILTRPETIIGRSEGCDIGLFGGVGVEKVHARIVQQDSEYWLHDENTPGGTFVNDLRIRGPTRLRSGDRIRVGDCQLLFQERRRTSSQTAETPED